MMGFTLDKVVPWGHSYNEYVSKRLFGLAIQFQQGGNEMAVIKAI
ncbi:MAG: hypothetical protein PHU14_08540 [Methylovulum sp.]|nr:hypothetical protein [Methylovulum sp.]